MRKKQILILLISKFIQIKIMYFFNLTNLILRPMRWAACRFSILKHPASLAKKAAKQPPRTAKKNELGNESGRLGGRPQTDYKRTIIAITAAR
jgi:hypothetical protein